MRGSRRNSNMTVTQQNFDRSLPVSLGISSCFHAALILAGLVVYSKPWQPVNPGAFEIIGVDAVFKSGTNVREATKNVAQKVVITNPEVEESYLDKTVKKEKEETFPTESKTEQKGDAGDATQSIGSMPSVWQTYAHAVRKAIQEKFYYPSASRSLGETGTVRVAFSILPDGEVTGLHLKAGSAFERLNVAALEIVKQVRNVPPLPVDSLKQWDTEIAIDFLLR